MDKFKKDTQFILDVKVDFKIGMLGVLDSIEQDLLKKDVLLGTSDEGDISSASLGLNRIVCTTNPEFILAAQDDLEFRAIINNSYLSVPDGSGVIFAKNFFKKACLYKSKLIGTFFGLFNIFRYFFKEDTVNGVDLVYELCSLSSKKGYSIFILGGWPKDIFGRMKKDVSYDLAEETKKNLLQVFPNLNVVGATSQFNFSKNNDASTISYIRKCMREKELDSIDIVFVAYGHANQEKWLKRNLHKVPGRVGVGVGGAFDYLSGVSKRPPVFIRSIHMEWLYRLFMQPWRIKRIYMAFFVFPVKFYLNYLKN